MIKTKIQLAIVIPAYKGAFLDATLESLSFQTDKRFNVYIGNDAGDKDIINIIDVYRSKLNITYKYFNINIGNHSLVNAWHRCIELTKNEPWLWILPDDDFITSECVESFYSTKSEAFDLYRFKATAVNCKNEVIIANEIKNKAESAFNAFYDKIKFKRISSLAEYIFSRDKLIEIGGFPDYPFAWGSDDVAWYLIGREKGICSLPDGEVFLRQSGINISSNFDKVVLVDKIKAQFKVFSDLLSNPLFKSDIAFYTNEASFNNDLKFYLFQTIRSFKIVFPLVESLRMAHLSQMVFGGSYLKNLYRIYLSNYRIRRF